MKLLSDFMAGKAHPKKGSKDSLGKQRIAPARRQFITKDKEEKAKASPLPSDTTTESNGTARRVKVEEMPLVPRDTTTVTEPAPQPERTSYDGDTAIKLYLREIGQVALLTPQQEVELAAKIKKGDKKAREQMIKANLRLVVKIAHDYEGFGLPLLEALACGAPCIASDASSLPEVAGVAAMLVPPDDVGAWADALERVWHDVALQADLRVRAIRRAAEFSWAES